MAMSVLKKVWPEWTLGKRIGSGSYGVVYEAVRSEYGVENHAAIKVISIPASEAEVDSLRSEGLDENATRTHFENIVQDFINEIRVMVSLDGRPNIVNVKDYKVVEKEGEIGWHIFILMELLTPFAVYTCDKTLTEKEVIKLGCDICTALETCEQENIIHRDIKPGNILVHSKSGEFKLGDFGIARKLAWVTGGLSQRCTPKYMAPEVATSTNYDSRVDIYSLGIVLYQLLNGMRIPFQEKKQINSLMDIDNAVKRRNNGERLPSPSDASPAMANVILRACAFDPEERYASAAEMHEALKAVENGTDVLLEQEKTTCVRPVMGDLDATMAVNKATAVKPKTDGLYHADTGSSKKRIKLNAWKYLFLGLGTVIAVVLFFLLRSCDVVPFAECNHNWIDIDANKFTLCSIGCIEIPFATQSDADKSEAFVLAEKIRSEFVDGDATEERFDALVIKYSEKIDYAQSGIYQNVYNGQLDDVINDWLFNEIREIGSTGVIQTDNSYIVAFCSDKGEYCVASDSPQYCKICHATNDELVPFVENGGTTNNQTVQLQTQGTVHVQAQWSEWVDNLPTDVSIEKYEIDEKKLYSSRTLETISSTEKNEMSGWELYDTVEANGDFGPWSDWTVTKVDDSATREVETQTCYRYRDKETATSSFPDKNGWIQYDMTYTWSSYGSWSGWTTAIVKNSESRKVETKTQYRYRNVSYSTKYTDWGPWSSWQDEYVTDTDLNDVATRTVYEYYFYVCPGCGTHLYGWDFNCFDCGTYIPSDAFNIIWGTISQNEMGFKPFPRNTYYSYAYYDGQMVFRKRNGDNSKFQYQYRTRSTYQATNYGEWSAWNDTVYSSSAGREVENRIVYRYCDRSQISTYHFYRWGTWSDWSPKKVSGNNDRQVESTTYYRYRDQARTQTYYFRRWTDWSTYSENPVAPSETVEVRTITQYRYKSKEG